MAAGRLGETQTFRTQDAYGRGPISRLITLIRGRVRSGDSGGPVVDGRGRVLATTFAASVGPTRAGAATGCPTRSCSKALSARRGPVDTGPCAE